MGGGEALQPTKYHSIDEIPDELVQKYSKRDPNNPLYRSRRWVNLKKRQILFGQLDGVPIHLRTFKRRVWYYGLWTATISSFFYTIYKFKQVCNK